MFRQDQRPAYIQKRQQQQNNDRSTSPTEQQQLQPLRGYHQKNQKPRQNWDSLYNHADSKKSQHQELFKIRLKISAETLIWMYYVRNFDSIVNKYHHRLHVKFDENSAYIQGSDQEECNLAVKEAEYIGNQEFMMKFIMTDNAIECTYGPYLDLLSSNEFAALRKKDPGLCVITKQKFNKIRKDMVTQLNFRGNLSEVMPNNYVLAWVRRQGGEQSIQRIKEIVTSIKSRLDQRLTPCGASKFGSRAFDFANRDRYTQTAFIYIKYLDALWFSKVTDLRAFEKDQYVCLTFEDLDGDLTLNFSAKYYDNISVAKAKIIDQLHINQMKMINFEFNGVFQHPVQVVQSLRQIIRTNCRFDIFTLEELISEAKQLDQHFETNLTAQLTSESQNFKFVVYLLCSKREWNSAADQLRDYLTTKSDEERRLNQDSHMSDSDFQMSEIYAIQKEQSVIKPFNLGEHLNPQNSIIFTNSNRQQVNESGNNPNNNNNNRNNIPNNHNNPNNNQSNSNLNQNNNPNNILSSIINNNNSNSNNKIHTQKLYNLYSQPDGFKIEFYNSEDNKSLEYNKFDKQDFDEYYGVEFKKIGIPHIITPIFENKLVSFSVSYQADEVQQEVKTQIINALDRYFNYEVAVIVDNQEINLYAVKMIAEQFNCRARTFKCNAGEVGIIECNNAAYATLKEVQDGKHQIVKYSQLMHSHKQSLLKLVADKLILSKQVLGAPVVVSQPQQAQQIIKQDPQQILIKAPISPRHQLTKQQPSAVQVANQSQVISNKNQFDSRVPTMELVYPLQSSNLEQFEQDDSIILDDQQDTTIMQLTDAQICQLNKQQIQIQQISQSTQYLDKYNWVTIDGIDQAKLNECIAKLLVLEDDEIAEAIGKLKLQFQDKYVLLSTTRNQIIIYNVFIEHEYKKYYRKLRESILRNQYTLAQFQSDQGKQEEHQFYIDITDLKIPLDCLGPTIYHIVQIKESGKLIQNIHQLTNGLYLIGRVQGKISQLGGEFKLAALDNFIIISAVQVMNNAI